MNENSRLWRHRDSGVEMCPMPHGGHITFCKRLGTGGTLQRSLSEGRFVEPPALRAAPMRPIASAAAKPAYDPN
jgi:hypothetical protein